jgi:hypothetical protein
MAAPRNGLMKEVMMIVKRINLLEALLRAVILLFVVVIDS